MWRSATHEFNSGTSDGTWGFSQFSTHRRLESDPGFLVDGAATVRGYVRVNWRLDAGTEDPAGFTRTILLGPRDFVETGLRLPEATKKFLVDVQLAPTNKSETLRVRAPASDSDEDVQFFSADGEDDEGARDVYDRLGFKVLLAGIRAEGLAPMQLAGLWTGPLWCLLREDHPDVTAHWQTLSLWSGYVCDVLLRVVRHAAMVYKSTRGDHDELFDIISSPRDPGYEYAAYLEQLCEIAARGDGGREVSSSHDVVRDRAGTEDWLSMGPEYVWYGVQHVMSGAEEMFDHTMGRALEKMEPKDGRFPEDRFFFPEDRVHEAATALLQAEGLGHRAFPEGKDAFPSLADREALAYLPRMTKAARRYLAGVLDVVAADLVDLSTSAARKTARIEVEQERRHYADAIQVAEEFIRGDPEEGKEKGDAEEEEEEEITITVFRNDAGSNPYERTPAAADAALQAATKAKELISDVLRGKCTPPEKSPIGMVRMHRRRAKLGATFREFISQLGETRADGTARDVSDYLFATIHRGTVEILDPEHTCEEATLDIGHRIACFLREEVAETRAEEEEKEEMTVAVSSPASRSSTTKSERWTGPPWLIVLPAHVTLALNEDVEMGLMIGGGALVPYGGVPYASLASMFRAPSSASAQKKTADARERVWQKELTKARKEKEKRAKAKEEKLRKEREKEKRRAEQQRRKAAREAEREKRRERKRRRRGERRTIPSPRSSRNASANVSWRKSRRAAGATTTRRGLGSSARASPARGAARCSPTWATGSAPWSVWRRWRDSWTFGASPGARCSRTSGVTARGRDANETEKGEKAPTRRTTRRPRPNRRRLSTRAIFRRDAGVLARGARPRSHPRRVAIAACPRT